MIFYVGINLTFTTCVADCKFVQFYF